MSIINWDLWHMIRSQKEDKLQAEKIMNIGIEGQYLRLLKTLLFEGEEKEGRNGLVISKFGATLQHDMSMSFPLLTSKKMFWGGIVTELLWILRGDTNIKFLVDNNVNIWNGDAYKAYEKWNEEANRTSPFGPVPKLSEEDFVKAIKLDDDWANRWGELGPIYGKQWRRWNGQVDDISGIGCYHDQIANLIHDLKTNPDSRRLMVNAWNVGELDQMTLPPCHYGFQVYTREMTLYERQKYWANQKSKSNYWSLKMDHAELDLQDCPRRKISLLWSQRSADAFLGLPFNIASYALLLEILGTLVNMVPDQLIGQLGDVHIYEEHIAAVREQLSREMLVPPSLTINTEFWPTESGECGVGPLHSNINTLIENMKIEDFIIENYKPHPTISAKLIN